LAITKASRKLTLMNALNLAPYRLELADLRRLWSKPAALTVDAAAKPAVDAAARVADPDNARIFISMTMRRTRAVQSTPSPAVIASRSFGKQNSVWRRCAIAA
jgi:hypothetical protein